MPTGKNQGSSLINNRKALANGLALTPLNTTVQDTFEWWNSDAVSQEKRDEVTQNPDGVLQRETELLRLWNEQRN
jgi:2'-hydroxyisoflavone reductase